MADGPTYEEPLKNVWVIIEEWIETANELGREIHYLKENSLMRKGNLENGCCAGLKKCYKRLLQKDKEKGVRGGQDFEW